LKKIILLITTVFISAIVLAQVPAAQFSGSVTSGCSPLGVAFKDMSTGNPKFWNWDFGNGQLSNLQNPSVSYGAPGKYTVTLVVRNASGTNSITKTDYITVNPSPSANFNANITLACNPATIQFTDASSANGVGTITKYEWDFGDGTTSTQQNPAKTYNTNGYYNVSLRVTASTGCQSFTSKVRFIRIVSGIQPAFTTDAVGNCKAPFNINFINQTAAPGTLTYNWDFGNGASANVKDPSTVYNTPGNYNVKLTVNSSLSCNGSTQKTITITQANTQVNIPDSACVAKNINFQNNSTPAPSSALWSFGDGGSSTQTSPVYSYTTPNTYTVKVVNTYAFCKDSLTKNIKILPPPVVDFSSPKTNSCKAPFAVSFTDLSVNATSWNWDFGDGSSSTAKNPTHTYTSLGQFNVKLTIINKDGCENTITKPAFVNILAPVASIAGLPVEGCVPFSFSPVSSSFSVDGIKDYLWDFGDAGATSTAANPTHIYNNQGAYTVKLRVTTNDGCTASVTIDSAVTVGTVPTVNFTAAPLMQCAFQDISFTDQTTATPAAINRWRWKFGDGDSSNLQNPKHQYKDTGSFNITLTAWNSGCPATLTKPLFVKSLPPIAKFKDSVDCNTLYKVIFLDSSIVDAAYGPITYTWNFGDATPVSNTAGQQIHIYPGYGTYNATLTITNGGCTHVFKKTVVLSYESAQFATPKTTVCKNEKFTLSATNSNPANVSKYEWSINGSPLFEKPRNFDTSFASTGTYTIMLRVTDKNGCYKDSTATNYITVVGPTANFSAANNPGGGCKNKPITFIDASTTTNTSIVRWDFDFGDTKTGGFTAPPLTHIYTDTGFYSVLLKVTDDKGCIDYKTIATPVKITQPIASFSTDTTLFCPGGVMQFKDSSKGYNLLYAWNFGDGGTATIKNPTHVYTGADSTYTVKLKVTDDVGCSDSLTRLRYIKIVRPKPAFDIKDSVAICPPLETQFTFKGKDYESFFWDFGDGNISTLQNPSNFYNAYGKYIAKLYLVGYGGCLDSAMKTINVYNPYDSTKIIYTTPVTSCNDLTVNFSITTPPFTKFIFYFGDGAVDSSNNKTLSHFYKSPNLYSPYLILTDNLDCQVAIGGPTQIKILGAEPFFGMDKKEFCDTGKIFFTNYAIGNDVVVSQVWNFDDGSPTVSTTDADHLYTIPGTYYPSLTVTTQNGCVKTLADTVRIFNTPKPVITSADETCINRPENFTGSLLVPDTAAIKWTWDLGGGQTSTQQNPAGIKYGSAATYTIRLKADHSFGCSDTTSKKFIIHPLPTIKLPQSITTIIGGSVQLPAVYSSGIASYNWAPAKNLDCTNCSNPVASPQFNTTYTINVVDSNTCTATEDIEVIVVCNNQNYFVPNTFSPNNDNSNDVFYPRGKALYNIQSMRIFNRWGQMVFERKNFPANQQQYGWNGLINGKPAEADTYIFIIEIICDNAQTVPVKGNITLLR
jgi:gliding motility-associated-like protein